MSSDLGVGLNSGYRPSGRPAVGSGNVRHLGLANRARGEEDAPLTEGDYRGATDPDEWQRENPDAPAWLREVHHLDPLHFIRKFPDSCCAEVTRRGQVVPCERPAVAVARGPGESNWWPVCVRHSVGRHMVQLDELLAELAKTTTKPERPTATKVAWGAAIP